MGTPSYTVTDIIDLKTINTCDTIFLKSKHDVLFHINVYIIAIIYHVSNTSILCKQDLGRKQTKYRNRKQRFRDIVHYLLHLSDWFKPNSLFRRKPTKVGVSLRKERDLSSSIRLRTQCAPHNQWNSCL